MTLRTFCLAWTLLLSSLGCATTTRQVSQGATRGAISGSLESLSERENQQRMIALMRNPEVQAAARAFSEEAVDGTLAMLTEPERAARIEALTSRYLRALTRASTEGIADGIRRDLAPAMTAMMRQTMSTTMRELLHENVRRDMGLMTAEITRSATRAVMQGMAEGMRHDVAPAMQAMLHDPNTAGPVITSARTMTRELVLGSNDALKQIQAEEDRTGRNTLLGSLGRLGDTGAKIAVGVAVVGLLAIVGLLAWIWRLTTRSKRAEAASLESAERARLYSEVIHASEDKPWSRELHDLIDAEERRSRSPRGALPPLRRDSPDPARDTIPESRNTQPMPMRS